MAPRAIPTDEMLHTTMPHGTPDFPFAVYLSDLRDFSNNCMTWHWHEELEFSLVISGDVLCRCGADSIPLHAGDCMFVNQEVIHRYEAEDGEGTIVSFLFSPEFIAPADSAIYAASVQPCLRSGVGHLAVRREDGRNADTLRLFEYLRECVFSDERNRLLRTRNLLVVIWELLATRIEGGTDEAEQRQGEQETARLLTMAAYISNHYGERISLSDIASSANVSQSEALRCFHIGMQTTPVRYLNDYRLSRAKERLLTTTDSVTSIAESSGFESAGYFCRVFKAGVGCTPAEYRKRSRL